MRNKPITTMATEHPEDKALTPLGEKINELALLGKQRARKARVTQTETTARAVEKSLHAGQQPSQLPLWGDDYRGLPNSIVRGALFSARDWDCPREYYENYKIPSLSNIDGLYRGQELRQDDASVFMQLLHIAREVPLGFVVEFTGRQMLLDLGWTVGAKGYDRLRDCIDRLTATSVKLSMQQRDIDVGYGGSFVRNFRWTTDAGEPLPRWQVWLEPEIISLFKPDTYTLLEWQQRKKLNNRSPLTLWLHSFLATHRHPLPLTIAKYAELSNSVVSDMKYFRQALLRSLQRLVDIEFLTSFEIKPRSGLVHVTRNLSYRTDEDTSQTLPPEGAQGKHIF